MNDKHQLTQLAKVLVRQGERINLAIEQWQAETEKPRQFGDSAAQVAADKARVQGRIEAAMALSNGLREDLETVMSVDDCYRLAGEEVEVELDHLTDKERLRRKLSVMTAERDLLKTQLLESNDARQAAENHGPDKTPGN